MALRGPACGLANRRDSLTNHPPILAVLAGQTRIPPMISKVGEGRLCRESALTQACGLTLSRRAAGNPKRRPPSKS